MQTQPIAEFVLKSEYDAKMKTIEQKFDEFTEVMLGQFDVVYEKFADIDQKFIQIDLRFNRIDANLAVLNNNMGLIMKHLGIPDAQTVF